MKTLKAIIDFIFGKKYYIIVCTRVGCEDQGYITQSDIYDNKEELNARIRAIKSTRCFNYEWTESFRSHRNYRYDAGINK